MARPWPRFCTACDPVRILAMSGLVVSAPRRPGTTRSSPQEFKNPSTIETLLTALRQILRDEAAGLSLGVDLRSHPAGPGRGLQRFDLLDHVRRSKSHSMIDLLFLQVGMTPLYDVLMWAGHPTGIRTPVLTVKGWCPDRAKRMGTNPGTGHPEPLGPIAQEFFPRGA